MIDHGQSQSQLPSERLSATGIRPRTRRAEPATALSTPFAAAIQGKPLKTRKNYQLVFIQTCLTNPTARGFLTGMEPVANPLQAGQLIARGVARHLRQHDFTTILEFVPTGGLRVDVAALGPKGEVWIIECKSSRADFQSDSKWTGYLEWSDRFFFAVPADFPVELLPDEHGLIFADGYDAEIIRPSPLTPLAAARRKKITLKLARNAMDRLRLFVDPPIG